MNHIVARASSASTNPDGSFNIEKHVVRLPVTRKSLMSPIFQHNY